MKVSDRRRSGRREIFNTLSRKYVVVLKKKKKGQTNVSGRAYAQHFRVSFYLCFFFSVCPWSSIETLENRATVRARRIASRLRRTSNSLCACTLTENARPVAAVSVVTFSRVIRDTNGVVLLAKRKLGSPFHFIVFERLDLGLLTLYDSRPRDSLLAIQSMKVFWESSWRNSECFLCKNFPYICRVLGWRECENVTKTHHSIDQSTIFLIF